MLCFFRTSKNSGLTVLIIVYILAAVLGILIFQLLDRSGFYLRLFVADIAATLFVWMCGTMVDNASVYDPYWSVAPLFMLVFGEIHLRIFNAGSLLMTAVVAMWSLRLTMHWSTTFTSLQDQDWRYTQLRGSHPKMWFIINLLGIHLFPTVVVFFVLLPAFEFCAASRSLNVGSVPGLLLSLFAVYLQYQADKQMRAFRSRPENAGRVNRDGLWKYSRHPNYLGEILMWWGVYLAMLSVRPSSYLLAIGPLANTLMFIVISVPLIERRQNQNKPEYAGYMADTGMLLPKLPAVMRALQK
jgi:steroid 5-alpha reductase family enzyme